jgi:hypothetical protein
MCRAAAAPIVYLASKSKSVRKFGSGGGVCVWHQVQFPQNFPHNQTRDRARRTTRSLAIAVIDPNVTVTGHVGSPSDRTDGEISGGANRGEVTQVFVSDHCC